MKISERGLALIKKHEGLRTEAYKCPAGIWTIGYGHTGKVKATDKITEETCLNFSKKAIEPKPVRRLGFICLQFRLPQLCRQYLVASHKSQPAG